MIRQELLRMSSQHLDGSPMYPGVWLRTWVLLPGTRVWMCVSCVPYDQEDGA